MSQHRKTPTNAMHPADEPGWEPTGLLGTGHTNVLAAADDLVIVGADISGPLVSEDRGRHWRPRSAGLLTGQQNMIAALLIDDSDPAIVYLASGSQGRNGGVFRSSDRGRTWTLISASAPAVQFSGNNNFDVAGMQTPHPRSVGRLLALHRGPAGPMLLVGTFRSGVWASDDTGWRQIGTLTDVFIRSLALAPDGSGTLWLATWDEGIFRSTLPVEKPDVDFERMATPFRRAQALWASPHGIYATAADQGVWRSRDDGTTWQQIIAPYAFPNDPEGRYTEFWYDVHGYSDGAVDVLVATSFNAQRSNTDRLIREGSTDKTARARRFLRSTDGGDTWTALLRPRDDPNSLAENASSHVGDDSGEQLWITTPGNRPAPRLGGFPGATNYIPSAVLVQPGPTADRTDDMILIAGQHTVWRSIDSGNRWHPAADGLLVTTNRVVAVDPADPARVVVGNTDRVFVQSGDHGHQFLLNCPPHAATVGYDVAFLPRDRKPSTAFLATGHRDHNVGGELFHTADPFDPQAEWTPLGLREHVEGICVAAAAGRSDDRDVVLAAVWKRGVYRRAGAADWQLVLGPPEAMTMDAKAVHATLVWSAGTDRVWLFDPASGVWTSPAAGSAGTWRHAWPIRADRPWPPRYGSAFLASHPSDHDVVYVSSPHGVHRLRAERDGFSRDAVLAPDINAGPIAIQRDSSGGTSLYVACRPCSAHPRARILATSVDAPRDDVVDLTDEYYEGAAIVPVSLAAAPDGYLYLAGRNGVIRKRLESGRP